MHGDTAKIFLGKILKCLLNKILIILFSGDKKMRYFLIPAVIIIISCQSSAQEFYQVLDDGGTISIAYYTTSVWTSQILSWSAYDMASIQIYSMLTPTLPSTLDATDRKST